MLGIGRHQEKSTEKRLLALAWLNIVSRSHLRRITVIPVEALALREPFVDVGGHIESICGVYTCVKRPTVPSMRVTIYSPAEDCTPDVGYAASRAAISNIRHPACSAPAPHLSANRRRQPARCAQDTIAMRQLIPSDFQTP